MGRVRCCGAPRPPAAPPGCRSTRAPGRRRDGCTCSSARRARPSTYHDSVIVSAGNAAGSPASVPVDFVVQPCVAAAIALDVQLSDSLTQQSCAAPHRPGSFAQLYSFTGRVGDSVSIVMSAPALDGYVVLDTAATSDAPALGQNDQCAAGPGACLLYQLLRAAGRTRSRRRVGPRGRRPVHAERHAAAPAQWSRRPGPARDRRRDGRRGGWQRRSAERGAARHGERPRCGRHAAAPVEALPIATAFTGTPTA